MNSRRIHFELHLPLEQAQSGAVDLLAAHCELSRQKIKQAMHNGALWLESGRRILRLRRATRPLKSGDRLHFYYDESIQQKTVEAAELIADEKEYSLWNKPSGMFSQGSRWGDHCTLYRYAEKHLAPQRPAFIVHRLDRAASGLIILAHSKKTAASFSAMFSRREIEKRYEAQVAADLSGLALPFDIRTPVDNKAASSRIIRVENRGDQRSLLQIVIETGRKHQIRRHLAEQGWPIIGDRLYGSENTDEDLQLKSVYLKFNCPLTGHEKVFTTYKLKRPA